MMNFLRSLTLFVALCGNAVAQNQQVPIGPSGGGGGSGGGGSGTVTSVSVATANGISGTVANPTTTPAITLTCAGGTCAPAASPTFTGTVTMPDSSTITSSGISGTTINNSVIGGSTAAAGTFTALAATGLTTTGNIIINANGALVGGITGTPNPLTVQTVNQTGANNASTVTLKGGNNSQASGTNNAGAVAITGGNASGAGSTGNGGNVTITAGTSVGGTAGAIQLASLTVDSARLTIGSLTAAAGQNGDLGQIKETDAAAAPGAGYAVLKWVAGSGTSCNLIAYAGTSATPVTIASTVGSGC
jgi:hypothetical protein